MRCQFAVLPATVVTALAGLCFTGCNSRRGYDEVHRAALEIKGATSTPGTIEQTSARVQRLGAAIEVAADQHKGREPQWLVAHRDVLRLYNCSLDVWKLDERRYSKSYMIDELAAVFGKCPEFRKEMESFDQKTANLILNSPSATTQVIWQLAAERLRTAR